MRVLLISCYELGHQPLSLALPRAFLERAGHDVTVVDVSVSHLDDDALRRAELIGISVPMHTALRLGVEVAARARRTNPRAHVSFYGLYAALNADYLRETLADSVLAGELEENLVALASGAARGPALAKLSFPVPARKDLPGLEHYAHLERSGGRVKVGYVEASRGCLHVCRHCPIPPVYQGRFFVLPREVVLEDVRHLIEQGAEHITFGDPDFLNGPGHSLGLARALHAAFPRVSFDFTAKVEHLLKHRGLLPEIRDLGCAFVVSAVESLSNTVLTHLQKGHTSQDVYRLSALLRNVGIPLRPSLVPFTPWSTTSDYDEILRFIEGEGLVDQVDPIQLSIRLLVPPGSVLLDDGAIRPYLRGLVPGSLSYAWTHPDPGMDDLHLEVSRLVEDAATEKEDPSATFVRIVALASGRRLAPLPLERPRPPRLTEDWFC